MSSIWYIGASDSRSITGAQWLAAGFSGAVATTWDLTNGWSLPQAGFTTAQINYLDADIEFMVNAPDGPNTRHNGTENSGPIDPSQTPATKAYVDARIGTIGAPPVGTPDFSLFSSASGAAIWYRKQQIRDAMLNGRWWMPDETTIDGTADDVQVQASIAAADAAGGGVVYLAGFLNLSLSRGLNIPTGVHVVGGAVVRSILGGTGTHLNAAAGFPDPYVVNFATNVSGASISGVNIAGRGRSATALGGVHINTGCNNIAVYNNWIGNMSDSCIRFEASTVACYVEKNVMGYDVCGRTLTSRCAVMEVNGTDHAISDNECSGGFADAANTPGQNKVSYPGTFYRTGIWVRGGTHKFSGNVPEFCDAGWWNEGVECVFLGDRADYSAGHGWIVDGLAGVGGYENLYVGCRTFGAGIGLLSGGITVWHGAIHQNGAKRNRWVDYNFWIGGASSPLAGYGWADFTTGNSTSQENTCWMPNIEKREVVWDTIYRADPATSCWPDSVGLAKRPPARQSHGAWNRGGSGYPGRSAQSDGQFWYDIGGDIVGNLAPPRAAEQIYLPGNVSGSTIAWEPFSGATADCSVTNMFFYGGVTAQGQKINAGTVTKVTVIPQGATNGYFTLGNAIALHSSLDMPQCVPGRSYTVGFEMVAEGAGTYTATILCRWWNAGFTAFQDAAAGFRAAGSISGSNKSFLYTQGNACPAGFPQLELVARVSRAGLTNGEILWVQHMFVAWGLHTAWSET